MTPSLKKILLLPLFILVVFSMQETVSADTVFSSINRQKTVPRLDIILVLDNSGSMLKNDPNFLTREVVTNFSSGIGDQSRLGMVIFDREALLAEPLKPVSSSVEKANFLRSLEKINYKGQFSDTPSAIERALYELKTNGRKEAGKVIILLTDGIVDTGDPLKDREKEKWLREDLTLECKKEEIRIFSIAFSDKADFSLIQALAFKTDGEYFRAFAATEIQPVFNKINTTIYKTPKTAPPETTEKDSHPTDKSVALAPTVPNVPTVILPPPEPKPPPAPVSAGSRRMPYILGGALLFVVLILIFLMLSRRSRVNTANGTSKGFSSPALKKAPILPRAELIDIKNITAKKTLRLAKTITSIGRDSNNDVAIQKDTVSSFHATIEYRNGFFILEDQRSKNKTFLNGKEVFPYSPQKLKSGDVIAFNIYKFIFLLPDLIPAGKTVMDLGGEYDRTRASALADKTRPSFRGTPAPPQAMLIDMKNITTKKSIMLDKKFISIGRGNHNDVDIPKNSISGSHAAIEYKSNNFYLEDLRSKNKTALNGVTIEPHAPQKLKSGDEIAFDVYKFIFLLEHQTPTGDTEESA